MGFFDKIREPVFLKEDSAAQQQLAALEALHTEAAGELAQQLEEEICRVKAGILGEQTVHFELANSHIPMYVLHDLYLEHDGLSAQIDYLLVTRKRIFVLECKNLYGDITITSSGDFIRTMQYGKRTKKEGIYSPITQNRRHLDLIKAIRAETRTSRLFQSIFEKSFYENYRSLVVLSNPKTVLNDRYAKKEIKAQVLRADQLAERIRSINAEVDTAVQSEKDMEALAQFFLALHKPQSTDYTQKYREALAEQKQAAEAAQAPVPAPASAAEETPVLCPVCGAPMVRRKATRGKNAGQEFYGCSRYPKCRGIVSIP